MKKTFVVMIVFGVVAMWLGGTYYAGNETEKLFQAQLDALFKQNKNIELVSHRYEKEFFGSSAMTIIKVSGLEEKGFQILVQTDFHHGPILIEKQGVKFGVASSDSHVQLTGVENEFFQIVKNILPIESFTFHSTFYVHKAPNMAVIVPSLRYEKDGAVITFGGLTLNVSSNSDFTAMKGTIVTEELSVVAPSGTVTIESGSGNMDFTMLGSVTHLGAFDFEMSAIEAETLLGGKMLFKDVGVVAKSELVDGKYNFMESFNVSKLLAGSVSLSNMRYIIDINGVSEETLLAFDTYSGSIHEATSDVGNGAMQKIDVNDELIKAFTKDGLGKGVEFNQRFEVSYEGKPIILDLDLMYVGMPEAQQTDLLDEIALLSGIKGKLYAELDEASVMSSPFTSMFAQQYLNTGHIVSKGGKLIVNGSLSQGEVLLNNQAFPLEDLLKAKMQKPMGQVSSAKSLDKSRAADDLWDDKSPMEDDSISAKKSEETSEAEGLWDDAPPTKDDYIFSDN